MDVDFSIFYFEAQYKCDTTNYKAKPLSLHLAHAQSFKIFLLARPS